MRAEKRAILLFDPIEHRKEIDMETLKFDELNLSPEILRGVKEMGFEEASPIQSKAIPIAMTGADIIGQAQTGTGKTAAFGIPVLEKVKKDIKHPQT